MASESREDIPLRKNANKKQLNLCSEDFLGGSKFINVSLAILTIVITVALFIQIYYGDYQIIPHGSVATDSKQCSIIGTEILKKGGNAVDAAVASAFCLSVISPHTTGLDGQGEAIIYNHKEQNLPKVITFNKRSASPAFLPNLVVGLAYLYLNYCNLPWKELIEPSIQIARNGFQASHSLVAAVRNIEAVNIFGPLEEGEIIKFGHLSDTLEKIASFTDEKLEKAIPPHHQPEVTAAKVEKFDYYNVFVPDGLSGGPVLLHTLKLLEQSNFTKSDLTEETFVPKVANINKLVYQELNISQLFYEGTSSNIAVMDDDDFYVSLVTGLHAYFGSRIQTAGGYFLDIKTSKEIPFRFPVLLVDKDFICARRIIFGASDYVMASQIIGHLIIGSENVTTSIEAPRFDIKADGSIALEDRHSLLFNDNTTRNLEDVGSVVLIQEPYNSCNIVEKMGDTLSSHSDSRGGGLASRF